MQIFDVLGYHSNIKTSRSKAHRIAWREYVDWTGGDLEWQVPTDLSSMLYARTRPEYHAAAREVLGNQYITGYSGVKMLEGDLFKGVAAVSEPSNGYVGDLPDTVSMWRATEMRRGDRPMSLVIVGPSRKGKTEMARSLGQHHYVHGEFHVPEISDRAEYLIIDDCGWKGWRTTMKSWIGGQKEISVRRLYKGGVNITWDRPCVIVCNDLPETIRNDPWFSANTIIITIE
jgi:hypothetical protein